MSTSGSAFKSTDSFDARWSGGWVGKEREGGGGGEKKKKEKGEHRWCDGRPRLTTYRNSSAVSNFLGFFGQQSQMKTRWIRCIACCFVAAVDSSRDALGAPPDGSVSKVVRWLW